MIDYVINFDYIINELCEQKDEVENTCLGKCHLAKEVKKQTDFPEDNKVIIKVDFLKIPHTIQLLSSTLSVEHKNILMNNFVEKEIKLSLEPNTPPPKILPV